jgi:2,5-diamino-6-(ribosylamino)-4(3H)-pyrimidinone 5'-phosphate reductase
MKNQFKRNVGPQVQNIKVQKTMKPYLICHMISTVDGKIIDKRWPINGAEIFETSAATIKSDGWIVGRTTMQPFSSQKPRRKRRGRFNVPKTDFVGEHTQKTYAVVIDPSGKLSWDVNTVDTEHVIEVLSEKVTAEYLDYLRSRQVSYIFAGKSKIDLQLALRKLNQLFGIKRMTVQGGGITNGAFLNAGLLDELSLIITPIADGEIGVSSVFDISSKNTRISVEKLQLKSVRRYKQNCVWLKFSF